MELRPSAFAPTSHPRPLISCAQCGTMIYAAEWSEPVDQRRVRHLWECNACGYTFETMACFPAT
jgi:ribosomal protein L37AE/L43A